MHENFEDVNEQLKKHTLQIEDLRRQLGATSQLSLVPAQINEPKMHSESSAIELSELDKRYAQKPSVDTVIGRVKALEAANDELKDRTTQNTNGVNEHDIKIAEILKRLKDHDTNLDTHQTEIDQLKRQIEALSNVDTDGGNIDATALLRKIHFLEQKLDDKADKIEVI